MKLHRAAHLAASKQALQILLFNKGKRLTILFFPAIVCQNLPVAFRDSAGFLRYNLLLPVSTFWPCKSTVMLFPCRHGPRSRIL